MQSLLHPLQKYNELEKEQVSRAQVCFSMNSTTRVKSRLSKGVSNIA